MKVGLLRPLRSPMPVAGRLVSRSETKAFGATAT